MTNYYAAGSLVIDEDNERIVLFKKKNSDWYSLPFGKREKYETDSKNTAIRETFEETGLVINIDTQESPFIADKGAGKICHVWQANINKELTSALQSLCDKSEGEWFWGDRKSVV